VHHRLIRSFRFRQQTVPTCMQGNGSL